MLHCSHAKLSARLQGKHMYVLGAINELHVPLVAFNSSYSLLRVANSALSANTAAMSMVHLQTTGSHELN